MESTTSKEYLSELLASQKKMIRLTRISFIVNIIFGVILIAAVLILVPQLRAELEHAENSLTQIDALAADAGVFIKNANSMITENTDEVAGAVKKLSETDIEGLNQAIENLNKAVEPLVSLAGLFSR